MVRLLDANVLIDANRDYYPIGKVDEFWDWLVHKGSNGDVKVPLEIYEEIKDGKDALAEWAKEKEVEAALLLSEDVDVALVQKVVNEGYANDLTDIQIEQLGRDPFLIAYAMAKLGGRTVVTTEVSRPSKKKQNRKVPDVCSGFGIPCCNTFQLIKDLNFSTNWKASI